MRHNFIYNYLILISINTMRINLIPFVINQCKARFMIYDGTMNYDTQLVLRQI